ncbi:MAG: T9SS type A sorting domain-containing protein, partial [Bacteroidia bacterium]|nr:T9SS type A sorting domain-containing protein [Bacteroidia bacterium]
KITVSVPRSLNLSSVKLFSLSGKCLLESGEQKNKIDGSHLLPGVYIIQVVAGDELFVQKMVKQ